MPRRFLVALASVIVSASALAAEGPRWSSGLVPWEEFPEQSAKTAAPSESPFTLLSVRWELDLRGAVATGRLIETHRSTGGSGTAVGQARYRLLPPGEPESTALSVLVDGQARELDLKPPAPSDLRERSLRFMPGTRWSEPFEIPSGGWVEVRHEVRTTLSFREGWSTLRLPIVTAADPWSRGRGASSKPDSATLEASLLVHHDEGTVEIASSSHAFTASEEDRATRLTLEGPALVEEGGVVLSLRLDAADEKETGLDGWVSELREDGTRDLLVVLTPPAKPDEGRASATDVVFVVDRSGSMKGAKLDKARAGLRAVLDSLEADDAFGLVSFAGQASAWQGELAMGGPQDAETASDWLQELTAEGGTQLTGALELGLGLSRTGRSLPLVVVLTDGAIADADEVEKALRADGGDVRVLFVGIGAEPQQDVLRRLAAVARGEAAFAREPSDVVNAVTRLFDSFSAPLAWDLELEAVGAELVSTWPERLPDLHEGRPVSVFLRVRGGVPNELRLRGTTVDGELGFDRSIRTGELPEARGLRGPRELEPEDRPARGRRR